MPDHPARCAAKRWAWTTVASRGHAQRACRQGGLMECVQEKSRVIAKCAPSSLRANVVSRACPGAEPAQRQEGKTQQETEHQTHVHRYQQDIVAQIVEMRNAAFVRAEITHRRRNVDRPGATPYQAHRGFGVEVEAAHRAMRFHY